MDLVTASQMGAIERFAMAGGAVTGTDLMERAGRGVVAAIFDNWPETAAAPGGAVVLCGPGNNGGDGFVIARLLAEKGWAVAVWLLGDEAHLPPDAALNYRRWREIGEVRPLSDLAPDAVLAADVSLVVDALFGTGMKRPLPPVAAALATSWAARGSVPGVRRLVAVDMPSGVDGDSGKIIGSAAFEADLTVTFGWPKPAHFLADGPSRCGLVHVAPLGIEAHCARAALIAHHGLASDDEVMRHVAALARPHDAHLKSPGHKYDHGHVLVLSGGVGKGGAARLAARAALRIGAGAATVGAPPAALIENAAHLTAVMLTRIRDAEDMARELADARIRAVVIGPGLGVGDRTRALIQAAYQARDARALVLDADALTSFADDPQTLFAMAAGTETVLTPHMGEFRRLFPDLHDRLTAAATESPAYSKIDAVRDAAKRAGCAVLLKGPDTVISGPDGAAVIASAVRGRACPWLATAGAGDVLAGFIAGLTARGYSAARAAEVAAWLHQECARAFGPGLIAEDLAETLPRVLLGLSGTRSE